MGRTPFQELVQLLETVDPCFDADQIRVNGNMVLNQAERDLACVLRVGKQAQPGDGYHVYLNFTVHRS